MRRHDARGEREALPETGPAGPAAASRGAARAEATAPADGTGPGGQGPDGTQRDAAAPDAAELAAAESGSPDGLDDLRRRLDGLPASHPSSPAYGRSRGAGQAPPGPLRGGEPYRPWFSSGDPAEPWFTADPGDPPG
jgi:hypothetical protein